MARIRIKNKLVRFVKEIPPKMNIGTPTIHFNVTIHFMLIALKI
jgi:hypothetical protein